MKGVLLGIVASVLAGCMTTETSCARRGEFAENGHRVKSVVNIQNTGWFLLDLVPLWSGDPGNPDGFGTVFFRNTLCAQSNIQVLDGILSREKCRMLGTLTSHEEDEGFLFFVVTRRSYHTTAVLLED